MSKKETLKDQILTESIKILGVQGFEGLSLREVAKKLKVTHQAPYHYFPDKGSLLIEIKKMGFDLLNQEMEKALSSTEETFPRLNAVALVYFDFCIQNPGYFRAMFAPTASGQGIRVPEAQKSFSILIGCVELLQKEGYIQKQNPEIIAMLCWTYMHGLVSLVLEKYPVVGNKYEPRDLAIQMTNTLHQLYGKK